MTIEEQEERRVARVELGVWRRRTAAALKRSSSTELFAMWSAVRNSRRGKLKKSFWFSEEIEKAVQKLLGVIGIAARKGSNVGK